MSLKDRLKNKIEEYAQSMVDRSWAGAGTLGDMSLAELDLRDAKAELEVILNEVDLMEKRLGPQR